MAKVSFKAKLSLKSADPNCKVCHGDGWNIKEIECSHCDGSGTVDDETKCVCLTPEQQGAKEVEFVTRGGDKRTAVVWPPGGGA